MTYGDVRDRLMGLPHPPGDGTAYALLDLFTVRHELIRAMSPPPRSVFEFGALYGFFLVTAIDAAPSIRRVGWVDNESYVPGSNELCRANVLAARPALAGWTANWTEREHYLGYMSAARQGLIAPWGGADLVQVDGDHSYEGCLADLDAAELLEPRWVMLDDWTADGHSVHVQAATSAWLRTQPAGRWRLTEHETRNGIALLTREDTA